LRAVGGQANQEPNTQITRRGFFWRSTAILVAPLGVSVAGCQGKRSGIDAASLEALLDTFIPADQDPGALQASVPAAIMKRIRSDRVAFTRYDRLLTWISQRSIELHQRPFSRLDPVARHELVEGLYRSSGRDWAQLRIDVHIALEHCLHAFYSSPAAERVIGYHPPIAGGYPGYGEPAVRPR